MSKESLKIKEIKRWRACGDSIWSSHEIVNKKSILNVKQQIEYE